jgi:hypothetical protein
MEALEGQEGGVEEQELARSTQSLIQLSVFSLSACVWVQFVTWMRTLSIQSGTYVFDEVFESC